MRESRALILIIISFIFFGLPKIANAVIVYPTKASISNDSAIIRIFDFSHYKQLMPILPNCRLCLIVDGYHKKKWPGWSHREQRVVWSRNTAAPWVRRLIAAPSAIIFSCHTVSDQVNNGIGFSRIGEMDHKRAEIVAATLKIDSSDTYLRPISEFDRFACPFRLFVDSDPEGKSESCNSERPESREKSGVAVNEVQRTERLTSDEIGGDDPVIFGSLAALLAGILTYAGLKRGCDFIFGPSENDYNDKKCRKKDQDVS